MNHRRRTTVPMDKPLDQSLVRRQCPHEPGLGTLWGAWTGQPCSRAVVAPCPRWAAGTTGQLSSSRPTPAESTSLQPWGPGALRRCCTGEVRTLPWSHGQGGTGPSSKPALLGPRAQTLDFSTRGWFGGRSGGFIGAGGGGSSNRGDWSRKLCEKGRLPT